MTGIAGTMSRTFLIPSTEYPREMQSGPISPPPELQEFHNNIEALETHLFSQDFDEAAFLQQFITNGDGNVTIEADEPTDLILGESTNVVRSISEVMSKYGGAEIARLAVAISQQLAKGDALSRFDLDGLGSGQELVTPLLTIRKTGPIDFEITLNTWEKVDGKYVRKEVPDFRIQHVQDTLGGIAKPGSYVDDGKGNKTVKGKGPWGTILTLLAVGTVALGFASARNKASGGVVVPQEQIKQPISSPAPTDFNPAPITHPTEVSETVQEELVDEKPIVEKKMSLEDWKEVFSGEVKNDRGGSVDLSIILTDDYSNVITDSAEVIKLPFDAPIVLLMPTGEIRVWSTPQTSSRLVDEGAVVLLAKNKLPDVLAKYSIKAANRQYQNGNRNIFVSFGSGGWSGYPAGIFLDIEDLFILEIDADGRYSTPVIRKPLHYLLYKGVSGNYVASPPLEDLEESEYWIDPIIKAGYDAVSPSPKDFSEEFGF
jgi:hypothetical protein